MTSKRLIELLEDIDQTPRCYSGRGMFGQACVGVELENMALAFTVGAALAKEATPREREELSCLRVQWDTMGLEAMLYFPDYGWPRLSDETDQEG